MLEFALEWWAGILAGLYFVGGYLINQEANKTNANIDSHYLDFDHMTEEDKANCDRSRHEVQQNKSLQYIHLLLGIVAVLLAGILATLLKAS